MVGRAAQVVVGGAVVVALVVGVSSRDGIESALSAAYVGFEPPELFLGEHDWHSTVPFTLTFVNNGARELTIESVSAPCEYTVVDADAYRHARVGVQDSLTLSGTLAVGSRPGPARETIDLLTTSGQTFSAALNFVVHPTYRIQPTVLRFDDVDLTAEGPSPVLSAVFGSEGVSIVGSPSADVPWLDVTLEEHASSEVEVIVRVVKRYLTYGSQTGRVSIPIDDANHDRVTILAFARGVMGLRPVPAHVFLRGNHQGSVRLLRHDGAPATPVGVSCGANWLDVSLEPDGRIEVRVGDAVESAASPMVWVTDSEGRRARFSVSVLK